MANIDLNKARTLMTRGNIDAIIATAPENFHYATGFSSMLAYLRHTGLTSVAVLPASDEMRPAVIVADVEAKALLKTSYIEDVRPHRTWIERKDIDYPDEMHKLVETKASDAFNGDPIPRPPAYNMVEILDLLLAILRERWLTNKRLGIEFSNIPVEIYYLLIDLLPDAKFIDSSQIFRDLRLYKTNDEISKISTAVDVTQFGLKEAIRNVSQDTVVGEIFNTYQKVILDYIDDNRLDDCQILTKGIVRVGWEPWIGTSWNRKIQPGEIIQFDVGVRYQGYRSDIGRTYVFLEPLGIQKKIHRALHNAHDAALEQMKPGRKLSSVFEAAHRAARMSGLGNYSRGHFGHSLGLDMGEDPPYLSKNENRTFEPGMVFAVETPLYMDGVGGFQIEDDVLITDDGAKVLGNLSREMVVLGR
jgi:Xaa-Pro aminopeptidase